MARVPITVLGYKCDKCGHEWIPRDYSKEPLACPECNSHDWNNPSQIKTNYDDFKESIRRILIEAGEPITWTEIRTIGKLPQLFPNNKWVKQMEVDIQLKRIRDQNGIIRWNIQ